MGGYALALQEIGRILGEARRWNGRRTGEMLAAVSTAVLLDMDLALEIYFEEARAESARARARVADAFEAEVGGLVGSSVDSGRRVEGDADVLAGISARTSARMASAAAASETASSGLQTIASASEEMSASVGEIGRQVREGARLTGMAAARAREASERVAALSSSAERIGAVVRTISEVAARTNLLALNATIEAARAGAAGKGFAVVASEVKDLARRSGREAEAIAAQVSAIQAETAAAVRMIEEIVSAIADADASATAISAAVDQQGVAAREIAQSVQDAVQGTLAAAAAVLETAGAARDLEDAARALRGRSADLARDGAALKAGVEGFLARIRAA
jgi:methyl-accepting chemotaxis protein